MEMNDTGDMEQGENEQNPGYTICIKVAGDGSISVGTEPYETAQEEAEEGAGPYKPVGSAREAMNMAMEILRNNGKMPDGSDEEAFQKGFGKQPKPMQMKQSNDEGY